MSIELWFAFVAASAILLIVPEPTILTIISCSLSHGGRANVPLVAAALGDSTRSWYRCSATARRLLSSPTARRRFNLAGGSLLSSAGVWALLAEHPA